MINKETVTVGSDAELPILTLAGDPFPVLGLVGGTKDQPRPLGRLGKGFFVQEDNVNIEFNIPPAKSAEEFDKYIQLAVNQLKKELPPTFRLGRAASTEYKVELLRIPDLQVFGCDPDYNAWTVEENPRPRPENPALRTAAGHVHIGWDNPTNEDRIALVKNLDLVLGYPTIGTDEGGRERRQLYGRAGAHRPKEYGVEYRVLGNAWLWGSGPRSVFNGVMLAVDATNMGFTLTKEEQEKLIYCINTETATTEMSNKFYALQAAVEHWKKSTQYKEAFAKERPHAPTSAVDREFKKAAKSIMWNNVVQRNIV